MTEQPRAVESEKLVDVVKERYGRIAEKGTTGCCGPQSSPCCGDTSIPVSLGLGYGKGDLAAVPEGADLNLGCGAPVDHLKLQPGETVLDLGSGGGLDAFLAAKQVGPTGHVIGVDMTSAMLERARRNAARSGHTNVDFREGRLEALPVDDASVDAVTSNCVINLVPDKGVVFREVARVLRTGGRLVISDVILDGRLPEALERDILAYVGCVSGAMQREAYFSLVREAGLGEIELIKDVDFLALVAGSMPEEVKAFVETSGVEAGDLVGKVHSVTFRARKS